MYISYFIPRQVQEMIKIKWPQGKSGKLQIYLLFSFRQYKCIPDIYRRLKTDVFCDVNMHNCILCISPCPMTNLHMHHIDMFGLISAFHIPYHMTRKWGHCISPPLLWLIGSWVHWVRNAFEVPGRKEQIILPLYTL